MFYEIKGKVIEEFGMYPVDVTYYKKTGIKERTQKANELTDKITVALS